MRLSSNLAERTRLEMRVFMVKWRSGCNTKVSDRVRHGNTCSSLESVEEEEMGLDSLPEDTIVASVLSSLNLSLFTVIHVLMSSVHFCKERRFLF